MKKLFVVCMLIVAVCMVSCGRIDNGNETTGKTITVADASFCEPEGFYFETLQQESWIYAKSTLENTTIMVSSESNEGVHTWNVTPPASTIEELFARRITTENSGHLEIVEIDDTYGCIVTMDDFWGKGAYFIYGDRIYIISVYRDFGMTDKDLEAFDYIINTLEFN